MDLDGTLEDSRHDMVSAIHRVRHRLGLSSKNFEELVPHVMRGMPHLYRNCFGEAIGEHDLDTPHMDEIAGLYNEEYAQGIADETRLYPGIKEALPLLEEMGRLAVVTNKPESLSRLLLSELGVLQHFITVVGGDSATKPKPAPEPLAEALRRSQRTGPVIMIGDSAGDIRCGRAFGATTVWCQWGYHDHVSDTSPEFSIASPSNLAALVARILRPC